MKINPILILPLSIITLISFSGCDESSDQKQQKQQESILQEGTSAVGMPAITKFAEKRLLKQILEMRDQNLSTYTYLFSEMTGKLTFLGNSIGFGIPAATQFTNPQKYINQGSTLPQADPNGLFSPASAEGTWVLMKNPNETDVKPVYIEPRIIVSPFKLTAE